MGSLGPDYWWINVNRKRENQKGTNKHSIEGYKSYENVICLVILKSYKYINIFNTNINIFYVKLKIN